MSELLQNMGTAETLDVEAEFDRIVDSIENITSPELRESLDYTPHRKEAGTADQGYRFD